MTVKTVREHNESDFERECNTLLMEGWKITARSCGTTIDCGEYDSGNTIWAAILEKDPS